MAGKTLVRPGNGLPHGIYRNLADMNRENHIKIFFKVGYKIAKIGRPKNFFDPSQKIKPSDQKVPLYTIYEDFYQLKLICTHQAHQNPQKTRFYFNKTTFWGDWCGWWVQINFNW